MPAALTGHSTVNYFYLLPKAVQSTILLEAEHPDAVGDRSTHLQDAWQARAAKRRRSGKRAGKLRPSSG